LFIAFSDITNMPDVSPLESMRRHALSWDHIRSTIWSGLSAHAIFLLASFFVGIAIYQVKAKKVRESSETRKYRIYRLY
jgi:hypothetical protein